MQAYKYIKREQKTYFNNKWWRGLQEERSICNMVRTFDSHWNVCVLRNLSPDTNHITCCHFELKSEFILFSCISPSINSYSLNESSLSSSFLLIPQFLVVILNYVCTIHYCCKMLLSVDWKRLLWGRNILDFFLELWVLVPGKLGKYHVKEWGLLFLRE